MKKNTLQKKILKKIYYYEIKKTSLVFFLTILFYLLGGLFLYLLFSIFFEILNDQKTFDLLNFFSEDFEVVKKYFFENVVVFYFELPKALLLLILILILLFIFLSIKIIKEWRIYKNKIKSFLKFFKNL
jgi:hypothetical protein